MSSNKSFLILNRHAPYASTHAKEAVDIALVASAFNQKVSILFMDDGVYQLLKEQDPVDIQQKNNSQTLPMLEMYDIKDVYVEEASLQTRNLTTEDLVIPVVIIDTKQTSDLLSQQDTLLNF